MKAAQLPKIFNLGKTRYEEIARSGRVVCYRRIHKGGAGVSHFVTVLFIRRGYETLPCRAVWFKSAWIFHAEPEALAKFRRMDRRVNGFKAQPLVVPNGQESEWEPGEFLASAEKNAGGQPMQKRNYTGNSEEPVEIPTLAELGLTKKESSDSTQDWSPGTEATA